MIIRGRKKVSIQIGIPRETIALFLMSSQPKIRMANTAGIRLRWVLGVVKHEHIA
jgi:hypothetical protein